MRICQPPENVSVGLTNSDFGKAQPFEHLRHPQLDAVSFVLPEIVGEIVVLHEQALVLAVGHGRVGQRVLDAIHFRAGFEHRLKGERHLVDDRAPGVDESVLRQVADRERRRPGNRAAIGLVQPGQHAQQRRLSRAIGSAQPDTLAVGHLPGHRIEQDAFAEGLGEGLELDHGRRRR